MGSNVANHRVLSYGDAGAAFRAADLVVRERFRFHKYASTPLEGYAVVAGWNPGTEILAIWANFQGPFIMHSVIAMALGRRLRDQDQPVPLHDAGRAGRHGLGQDGQVDRGPP